MSIHKTRLAVSGKQVVGETIQCMGREGRYGNRLGDKVLDLGQTVFDLGLNGFVEEGRNIFLAEPLC